MMMAPFSEDEKYKIRFAGPYLGQYNQSDMCKVLSLFLGFIGTLIGLGVWKWVL